MLIEFLSIILAYLIGSIPFGLILTKYFGYGDIRNIGSGNIGTTNVLRTGSKVLAAATLVCDSLKIIVAILIAKFLGFNSPYFVGSISLLGHLFPIWLNFKGGKGIASFLGLSLYLFPKIALSLVVSWVVTFAITRYSSLAALVSCVVAIILLIVKLPHNIDLYLLLSIIALILYKHKDNMYRLINGQESKFKKSK